MLRIPSMNLHDAMRFNQLIGQYNRGLITGDELLENLNCEIVELGSYIETRDSADLYEFPDEMIVAGTKIALEPYFHPLAYDGDRIAYHVHLI